RAAGAAGPPCRGCCIEPCFLWCATLAGGRPTARRAPSACVGGSRTSAPADHQRLASRVFAREQALEQVQDSERQHELIVPPPQVPVPDPGLRHRALQPPFLGQHPSPTRKAARTWP
uniref:Uncharacterized protein n=1 Tax=Triticum urartu TaxID=4572 RepID=A0A8R7UQE2_TRIUA